MVRQILKNGYFTAMSLIGIGRLRRAELVKTQSAAVLNLHRVTPDASPYWPPIHPRLFEGLLRYLDKHFEVRGLHELQEKQGKRPVAVLSFDDGYYDFIEYALPLLRKYGMKANMNVIPRCAESGDPIWNVRLYDFLAAAPASLVKQIKIEGCDAELKDESAVSKLRFGMAVSRFLKNRPRNEREELFRPIEALLESNGFPSTRMMSTAEIRSLANEVELGAHSYSHESMAHESDEFFEKDLSACQNYFQDKLGKPMRIYAFPNGSYRDSHIDHLRKQKVESILLVDEKPADPRKDVIPRITIYGDSPAEVRLRSVGFKLNRGA